MPPPPDHTPANTTQDPQAPASGDGAPKWFTDWASAFEAKNDGRFAEVGRDFGRMRERIGSLGAGASPAKVESGAAPSKPPQGGTSSGRDDVLGAMRLGEVRGKLPQDAQRELDEMLERGASIGAVAQQADFLARYLSKGEGTPSTENGSGGDRRDPPPPGRAATAAPRTSPDYPRSKSEAVAIAKKDPKRWAEIKADPNFDLTALPSVLSAWTAK